MMLYRLIAVGLLAGGLTVVASPARADDPVREGEAIVVHGAPPAPGASVVLPRSRQQYRPPELRQSFVQRVVRTVQRSPF